MNRRKFFGFGAAVAVSPLITHIDGVEVPHAVKEVISAPKAPSLAGHLNNFNTELWSNAVVENYKEHIVLSKPGT